MSHLRSARIVQTVAAVLLTLSASAWGQSTASKGPTMRTFLAMGVTGGGDTLTSVQWSNGETKNIKAGGMLDFRGGIEHRTASSQMAFQASIGYFFDRANGSNGSVTFARFPLEFVGLYSLNEKVRFGGGLRYALGAKLSGSGAAAGLGSNTLDAKPGAVLAAEYSLSPKAGISLRYVSEGYEAPNGATIKGDHLGLYFNWYL